MKKVILIFCMFSFGLLLANEGQELHQESCFACHGLDHDDKFYTSRVNKKMKSFKSLQTRVTQCATVRETGWFPEEEEAVTKWLNDKYYHLK